MNLKLLKDLWVEPGTSDELELLRYRSNLLGADLRITNFGGGNTSSKFDLIDPFTGKSTRVLAVKGSGGDLGSIKNEGFAVLYMDRLNQLKKIYRGEQSEDEMVAYYPSSAFGNNTVPASIDTPLHAFLPFAHVDHLHPDWAIAIAASANGKARLAEFNERFGHRIVWLPWQRPGFELGLMLERAVSDNPGCDGILLGSHGLFTWGGTHRECYLNSLRVIDEMGQFVLEQQDLIGSQLFGGAKHQQRQDALKVVEAIFPYLRGKVATTRRSIGHYDASEDVVGFVNSHRARDLAALGTSCPDHFIRTRIAPFYVDWSPDATLEELRTEITNGLERYRETYSAYYHANAEKDSPKLRDANPSVVLIPGVGMFTFGKNKKEARITGEFYANAIRVMAGATALQSESAVAAAAGSGALPQAKTAEVAPSFTSLHNYVALPPREAFRIEYWQLEEAKLKRMPQEHAFSRRIHLVVGGGSGIGRAVCLQLAALGAHLMIADKNAESALAVEHEVAKIAGSESVASCPIDIRDRASIREAMRTTVLQFGGIDGIINTAAIFLAPGTEGLDEHHWRLTLDINVTGNYLLAEEAKRILLDQGLPAVIVLTSSANAVVPKRGSEAYDVSKSAVNHLIGELAVGLKPLVRVNGIAPATVVEGSTMFPRDRVISSLTKYGLPHAEEDSTETLRERLARYYAERTLTNEPIRPQDCAEAIVWLASDRSSRTTGHIIPVDGGLPEAFLR